MRHEGNGEDLGQQLAVTKNDIRHLEAGVSEIKSSIAQLQTLVIQGQEKMAETYVRKDDYEKARESDDRRLVSISNRINMALGAFITAILAELVNLATTLMHK